MKNRLEEFLSAENISQSQFADSIGVARASISHILAGRNKPGYDFIENTMKRYPALNMEWLITGRGRMYKDELFGRETEIPAAREQTGPSTPLPLPDIASSDQENPRRISRVIVFYSDNTFEEIG